MSIIVSNVRFGLDESDDFAIGQAAKKLDTPKANIKHAYIYKKSLDARRRNNVSFVASVVFDLFENEAEVANATSDHFVSYKKSNEIDIKAGSLPLESPIIIIGFGPAGIFAANLLAQHGYCPIVFERGAKLEERVSAVNNFWQNGKLDERSNVQFGEGGAGTFSDGKLTTRISDSRCEYVLSELVKHGAPKEILSTAKPHIGTDLLRDVIVSMRKAIIKNGGRIYFDHFLEDIIISNNKVCAVTVNGEQIETSNVILAIGHSSRDTFKMIYQKGIAIEQKGFSVGVRIEQLQSTINRGLYGDLSEHKNIPIGEYQLSHKIGERAVYTFCMCPGGYVVPSCSQENTVVTNGMSEHARNGKNANSALVVSVSSSDFGDKPLDGMAFQERLERLAFVQGKGGYKAPAMNVGSFLNNETKFYFGDVTPSYSLGVEAANFDDIFPKKINDMMRIGLKKFNTMLNGFSASDGILTGVETRTSSPVRILRGENGASINVDGLYPCGEGAGYAGGIMSAAVDGMRIAEKIMSIYSANFATKNTDFVVK